MTTTNHEMAKAMCQHFLYACLIMNPADDPPTTFKELGVYQLTPKGLHVLEHFISKNGINYEHLHPVFSSQPICTKLLHLERHSVDDKIIVTQSVVTAIFRHFIGYQANYEVWSNKPLGPFNQYNEYSKGWEEAAEICAQFVHFGLISLVSDKHKRNGPAIIYTVRGPSPGGNSPYLEDANIYVTSKAFQGQVEPKKANLFNANQLQTMI
ncbi:hypothetical protein BDQ17DRAFT_1327449 [Cyathus striatus]|nr:hypothetical protein BDQ17DRAFT_1327449 [Cyathus striatus]